MSVHHPLYPRLLFYLTGGLLLLVSIPYSIASSSDNVFTQDPQVTLLSKQLLVGEKTLLTIDFLNQQPLSPPSIRGSLNLKTRFLAKMRVANKQQVPMHRYQYEVLAHQPGPYHIPPIDYSLSHKNFTIKPIPIHIYSLDQIEWKQHSSPGFSGSYGAALLSPKQTLFQGETAPISLKLILPIKTPIIDFHLPDLPLQNLSAWRFEPKIDQKSILQHNHQKYVIYSYESVLSPLAPGSCQIGPGRVRPTLKTYRYQSGMSFVGKQSITFPLPSKSIQSIPLPSPIPQGFSGAVGQFSLVSQLENKQMIQKAPLSVLLSVQGTGNLDHLDAPLLSNPNGWKVYEAAKHTRHKERRHRTGIVQFTQVLKPLQQLASIPPFQMTFFDPEEQRYKTIQTKSIPLSWKSSSPLTSTGNNTLFGLIDPPLNDSVHNESSSSSAFLSLIRTYWPFIPFFGLILLLLSVVLRVLIPKLLPSASKNALKQQFHALSKQNGVEFLRAAGRLIEKTLPPENRDKDLQHILSLRDLHCFSPSTQDPVLQPHQRDQILSTLKERIPCR